MKIWFFGPGCTYTFPVKISASAGISRSNAITKNAEIYSV